MSRGDAWSVAVTLIVTGGAYFVGGAKAAWACLFVGTAIALILHVTRPKKKEEKPEPVPVACAAVKDSFNPQFKQEANPQFHLHIEEKPKPAPSPTLPTKIANPPNLQFRRRYVTTAWVGHEISGHSVEVLAIEVGNELGEKVGKANDIRAHLTYKSDDDQILQRICPARWLHRSDSAYLNVGEGEGVIFAYDKGMWLSREHDGIDLRPCSVIELRLLDSKGEELRKPLLFDTEFGWSRDVPVCELRQAAS